MIDFDIEDIVPDTLGGYCGVLAPFIGYGLIIISILIHSWFSVTEHALSELGETGLSYNNVFNFALIITGVLMLVFIISLFGRAETRMGHIGLIGLVLGSIFLILAGIFPMGTAPHIPMAIFFYSTSVAGLIVFGLDEFFEFEHVWAVLIWSSLGITAISAGLVFMLRPDGIAIYEIIGTFPLIQFSLVFGTRLLAE